MSYSQTARQWIPPVYMMQGLPLALVTVVAPIWYKTLGLDNSSIALFTSLFILPWIFKFFIAPALETIATQRRLVLIAQWSMGCLMLMLGGLLSVSTSVMLSGAIFFMIAMAAAIHDINSDGLYLDCLTHQQQAHFIGIRTVFYQLGKLICQGGAVYAVGFLHGHVTEQTAWMSVFIILGGGILWLAFYDQKFLPQQSNLKTAVDRAIWRNTCAVYQHVLQDYRQLPHIVAVSLFIVLYNFSEAQLNKIFPLFMLDKLSAGGLALSVSEVGVIYGGIGLMSLLIGVTLSGFLLHRFTLKKCLVPFTVILAISNISYLLLVLYFSASRVFMIMAVILGEFSFGLSNGAYMLYLIQRFAKGPYAMSLYAIGTALMLLGLMIAGGLSGYLQMILGYTQFFMWIVALTFCLIPLAIYQVKKIL